jgi:hypothetical protein
MHINTQSTQPLMQIGTIIAVYRPVEILLHLHRFNCVFLLPSSRTLLSSMADVIDKLHELNMPERSRV